MNQEMNMESQQETIAQVKFQMDLLRMTALADRLSGPSVMQQSIEETEAIRVMAELTRTADQALQR